MTLEKVANLISEALSCELSAVTMEASLSEDLGADSLDAVDLGMALEDEFSISIPDDALGSFKTVGDIVRFIDSQAA